MPAAETLAVKKENIRTVRLRLLLTPELERILEELGDLCAKMWNELNYERTQLFKDEKLTKEAMKETYKEYYERYKRLVGSATAQQIANMNNEAWASFFATLKAKKEGRLPPFIKRISPPGYWKDRELGKRVKRVVIRSDRYVVEPVNAGEGYIVLRDYGLRIKYAGRIKWSGRQGRMVIAREAGRWFAYIPVEVGAKPPKSNPRGYIRGEHNRIEQREPRGGEVAFIDMGLNNLFAIVTTTGDAALVKGGAVKAEHYREKTEIRAMQETRDLLRNKGLEIWRGFHDRFLMATSITITSGGSGRSPNGYTRYYKNTA